MWLLCAAVAKLNSCIKDHMAWNAQNIYSLPFEENVCRARIWQSYSPNKGAEKMASGQ